ncbi:hypothetical protein DL93DRAFT_970213 [Clavulina sp. PMI_390]|nr:hypothetical protein DL93DRAFT_970213 [Clavulina sp. PMI_390]
MPPPSSSDVFHLSTLPNTIFVYQLPTSEPIPIPFINGLSDAKTQLCSITRTADETSIVTDIILDEASTPAELKQEQWKAYKMRGPMPFDLVGVVNNLTAPLKAVTIGVFVVSTWNTDYLLIPLAKHEEAEAALKADSWVFV